MTVKPIVIVGAGGHGKDLLAIIEAINADQERWEFVGFLDDNKTGPDIVGLTTEIMRGGPDYVVGINDPAIRRRMDLRAARPAAVLVHPAAHMGRDVWLEAGAVVAAGAICTTGVNIGRHAHLNVAATVSQGSSIGDYTTLSPGAHVCGDCLIGAGVSMGAGAVVINCRNVSRDVTIGAGAVVIDDIPAGLTVVGVPARVSQRHADPPNKQRVTSESIGNIDLKSPVISSGFPF